MSAPAVAIDAQEAARDRATQALEDLRTAMQARGASTPAFEKFIDECVLLISVHVKPQAAIDIVISVILGEHVAVRA